VKTSGEYEASIDYTCRESDAGAVIELAFKDASQRATVTPFWDPPLYTNQDTLPRPPAESTMKEFRTLDLGVIRLPAGQGPLTLRAVEIPGQGVADIRRVTLTLRTPSR
jgi:hypothetical protein